ncbi:MAG: heparan N-sulfatase, partial [Verrucomicrobiota bacterium]
LELAGVEVPDCIQGQSFVPLMKDSQSRVREVVFAEQNWHVYRNHSRLVRFGDYAYLKNNFPNQMNLSYESDTSFPAGSELWEAHSSGKTKPEQQQVFWNPCPAEELYNVEEDPHQLVNLAKGAEYIEVLEHARALLAEWSEQTGDSIQEDPTPNRHAPPQIENGQIVPAGSMKGKPRSPHAEMPGAARGAKKINHPGPIKLID